MINFNQDSVFNLRPLKLGDVRGEVDGLLASGEELVAAFSTVRDQVIFTNKRVIAINEGKVISDGMDGYYLYEEE